MTITGIKKILVKKIKPENLCENCDMSLYTSFRTGGQAALLVLPGNKEELQYSLEVLADSDTEYMVMGNGSNILVRDGGYKGVLVKLGAAFNWIDINGTELKAGSGALMSAVAGETLNHCLTGFEFASGIPGSLGGAVFMNAGAYGGEMVKIIKEVTALSKDGRKEFTLSADRLEMEYRSSIFHKTKDIVIDVTMQLKKGKQEVIGARMKELLKARNEKQPVNLPSAGSFFKRPEGHFAGKLIQDAGLKGLSVGGAQVSSLHSGFIVNTGNATAADIIGLMEIIQTAVMDQFGVKLEPEVRIIGT